MLLDLGLVYMESMGEPAAALEPLFRERTAKEWERALVAADCPAGAVRDMLAEYGYPSVAEDGYQSPSVVVSYTDDAEIKSGSKFASAGVQIAGGVPLMCGEGDAFSTFRIGLFGLDKWRNIQGTCRRLKEALDCIAK